MSNPTAFADINSHLCVSLCPYGWFGHNSTFTCRTACTEGSYADNYTRSCVSACSGTERLFSDGTTFKCVSQCPVSYYGNDQNWTCISSCPPAVVGYKLDISNLCIKQCPSPYFAMVSIRTCVINCGAGLFGDSATRICMNCPSACPTCLSLTQCLSCTANLYLSFGVCLQICPSGTYSNTQANSCVYATSCPVGTFGNNNSKSCNTTCPIKQFANATIKACDHCPQTCESCLNTSYCLTCISTAAYSSLNNQCYSYCNVTNNLTIYSFNGSCFSSCPVGTYLDYTGVNCQTCNSICLQCSNVATNCTSCSASYFFNQSCISQCPSGYYGSNHTCQVCTPSISSCSNPLTFKVTSTT